MINHASPPGGTSRWFKSPRWDLAHFPFNERTRIDFSRQFVPRKKRQQIASLSSFFSSSSETRAQLSRAIVSRLMNGSEQQRGGDYHFLFAFKSICAPLLSRIYKNKLLPAPPTQGKMLTINRSGRAIIISIVGPKYKVAAHGQPQAQPGSSFISSKYIKMYKYRMRGNERM